MKPEDANSESKTTGLTRRDFLKTAAVAGAAAAFVGPSILHAQAKADTINIGIIGTGTEGRVLLMNCLKIPGVRFKAVCDIWPHYRTYTAKLLGKYKQEVQEYTDYQDMLTKEKDLDAVIVASPDFVHAEHTIASLKAGKHVYCEKEMSNTIEKAKEMVTTSQATKKLLQIGHQRRSNLRYHMMLDYINNKKACGRLTNVAGNWNRSKPLTNTWTDKTALDDEALKKYGYDTMERFRNWRWYKAFSGGPIADLGSHQVDIFHWVIGNPPKSVMACGGNENYPKMEWYDNVIAIYEWDYKFDDKPGVVRGHYELFSTTSNGGYLETFMGTEGAIIISEGLGQGGIRREYDAPEAAWEKDLQKSLSKTDLAKATTTAPSGKPKTEEGDIKVGHSIPSPGRYYPPLPAPKEDTTEHMPHLVNFFDAIKGKAKLNCPGEVGYETAVSILRVNEAVAAGKKIEFKPEDFKV
jgi:predicted dehydrogenase